MRRIESAFTSTLVLVAACMVAEPAEGEHPSTARNDEHPADTSPGLVPPRYTIEELPTALPSGASIASKAICARRAVVGTATLGSSSEYHAIVLDASGVADLGTLGGLTSHGRGGNASGAIVGASSTGSTTHAFLYRNGVMQDLGTLGGASSDAFAINSSDQIVGQSTLITGGDVPSHAVLWDGCDPIDLGTLDGGAESFARDLNNAGDIVGTSSRAEEPFRAHAVVWRDQVIEALDANGALHSQAVAINEAGTIAGFLVYGAGQPYHAVIWHGGTMSDLGSFGSSAFALGLNDHGEVVGAAWNASGTRPHAFLHTGGTMLDLEQLIEAPGWMLLEATDICNDGLIVGNGWLDGQQRGFVLTPVP